MIKSILFDLDGTLYVSEKVIYQFAQAAYQTYAQTAAVSLEEARQKVEERRAEMKAERGYAVPFTLALVSLGVTIEQWHRENTRFFNAGDFLAPDPLLRKRLHELKSGRSLAVLTNNNRAQTERILTALGIGDSFDHVFTYESFKRIKPDPEVFRLAAATMGLSCSECLMVGDQYEVDLVPARAAGMAIHHVRGPADICCGCFPTEM